LTAFDGVELRYARWRPPARGRKGTVCIFGGRTEFIEKYFETISDLRQRGFAVATMDWRGQGGSSRSLRNSLKGHVENFSEYDADLAQFMSEVVLPDCPPPYFALAHSMGANIALRAACARDCWFERMVFTAPMIRLGKGMSHLGLIDGLAQLAVFCGLGDAYIPVGKDVAAGFGAFEGNLLTSDRRRFERNRLILEAAPQLGLGAPTIAWVRAAVESMKMINAFGFPPQVHVPILMIAGGEDRVVSNLAIEELAMQLKSGARVVIDGARHELLQEREGLREQVWAAFDAFVPGSKP
jgi:lysophospholipase